MPDRNAAALDFLLTRRSRPAQTLTTPVPDRETLREILTAAARSPDHGKLEPWRFLVLNDAALDRLAEACPAAAARLEIPQDKADKQRDRFAAADLAVVVVESPVASDKVPMVEQTYAVGGVCLALTNAALAAGFGANWLSGWASHDPSFVQEHLGLSASERVAGIIHIGTETSAPPDRPRPDLDAITTWVEA
ncbi:nitroreductase [Salipiger sp. IMCC34102]|uniref:nitroreductase family protein n=1 Tax=Salipiger sp. IMCC34102 TaxID=2510647 RepID=UPI00101BE783|nr:nitroreductase family protein [Salipiger sp. IMCC34102]RYH01905.1 nitroreductase [Salipiger sp. IMCC34102]